MPTNCQIIGIFLLADPIFRVQEGTSYIFYRSVVFRPNFREPPFGLVIRTKISQQGSFVDDRRVAFIHGNVYIPTFGPIIIEALRMSHLPQEVFHGWGASLVFSPPQFCIFGEVIQIIPTADDGLQYAIIRGHTEVRGGVFQAHFL